MTMTAVEYLAEKYSYITWMRNLDEISAATADEWRASFLKKAKEMEEHVVPSIGRRRHRGGAVEYIEDIAPQVNSLQLQTSNHINVKVIKNY